MTDTITAASFGAYVPALHFLVRIASEHPTLAAPQINTSIYEPDRLELLVKGPADVEAWREVLGASSDAFTLRPFQARELAEYLAEFSAAVNGLDIRVFALFNLAAPEQEGAAA